jgi:zinc protease
LSRRIAEKTDHPSSFILSFDAPTPGWKLAPQAAYQVGDEIWCIHQLTPPEGMVAQVISKIEGSITLLLPAPDPTPTIRHYILGKTWNWNSDPKLIFLKSLDGIADQLKTATPLKIADPKE